MRIFDQEGRLVVTFVKRHEPHMRSLAGVLGPPPRLPEGDFEFDEAVEMGEAEEYLAKERRAGDAPGSRRVARPR